MGSCLTCFKEPHSTALENSLQANREEMPDAPLHPAPSHFAPPTSSDHLDTAIISNGNHHVPISVTASESLTGGGIGGPVVTTHFTFRKSHLKLPPTMGIGDSRPSDTKLGALFDSYRERDEDMIRVDGIIQFCKDLQVLPEDFKILVLAWRLNAEQMCRFSRSEFVNGLKSMGVDTVKGIQSKLPDLVADVESNAESFKDLYRFTFTFGLDAAAGQRSLVTEMAVDLWNLVFAVRRPPILGRWLNFLERHPSIKGIPRDTWNMFLNFSETVGDDLSSYDDNEAWPSLFDDFVEYENDQANQNISKERDIDRD